MEILVPMTNRAQRVLQLAEDFAHESGHSFAAAEHLLYALLAEREGLAARLLDSFGVDAELVRKSLDRISLGGSGEAVGLDQLQHWAHEELAPLRHNYVGTEHLLLALTHVSKGRCFALMTELGLHGDLVRNEVYSILGHLA